MSRKSPNDNAQPERRNLWTAAEVGEATGGALSGRPDWSVTGVSIDSRTVEPGDLFVAIRGENADGHEYVDAAFQSGAAAVLVDHDCGMADRAQVIVDDTRAALIALAGAARSRTKARIIAVTGSVGKTSTKEALRYALGRSKPTHASDKSYNNDIGVPLSLARMPAGAAYGVFEVGMNHAGEITPLTRLIRPHVAMVTGVEDAHREFFDSTEAIADAKAEIFLGLEPDGIAVLNRDNRFHDRLAAAARAAGAARLIGFGFDDGADVRPLRYRLFEEMSCVTAAIGTEQAGHTGLVTFKVGAPGRHWVMNSLAVLATVQAVGGDLGLAGLALAEMAPVQGRGRRHKVALGPRSAFWIIDESYNANPASMRAALETLGHLSIEAMGKPGQNRGFAGRRIAVLGDMKELGSASDRFHRDLGAAIADNGIDLVVTVGDMMRHLASALPGHVHLAHVDGAGKVLDVLRPVIEPNDVIMVKGSLSMGMAAVVQALMGLAAKSAGKSATRAVKG